MTAEPVHQFRIAWIMDFMAKNRLPAVYQLSENVRAGGLMSYGASLPDLFRQAAGYVHKILQGTKPADLPVEQRSNSTWPSTSRLQRLSAFKFLTGCSRLPTR